MITLEQAKEHSRKRKRGGTMDELPPNDSDVATPKATTEKTIEGNAEMQRAAAAFVAIAKAVANERQRHHKVCLLKHLQRPRKASRQEQQRRLLRRFL